MRSTAIVVALATAVVAVPVAQSRRQGLTAIEGVRVGHHTLTERPTGRTVILTEEGATGGVAVRGSAPGTRDTELLDPSNLVEQAHAIVFSGAETMADAILRAGREATALPNYPAVRDLGRK